MRDRAYVLWFEEIDKGDLSLVGGKSANLGELTKAGIPVPPGFAVTSYAYKEFIERTGLKIKVDELLRKLVVERSPQIYEDVSTKIRSLMENIEVPSDIAQAIKENYRKLCKRVGAPKTLVAVRSSATAEDLPGASFAGQQDTYLNVKGEEEVLEKVKKCWSSLYTSRAIFYRDEKKIPHDKVLMSVVIQKMVNSKAAGVMFTIHPVTGEKDKIVIEGSWGLGETIVSGSVTPDTYVVDKKTLEIVEKKISDKPFELKWDPLTGGTVKVEVPPEKRRIPCLTDGEVRRLAELAVKVEQHYGHPQDIEWAIDGDIEFPENVFIVQSRPETVWASKRRAEERPLPPVAVEKRVALKGLPASPGVWTGKAKIVRNVEEAAQLLEKGDILVTSMTNPDWVPYMRVAGAIITDEGGITCHAAIVSRELGIPAIVGTGNATKVLEPGREYTVDAITGVVYEGAVEELTKQRGETARPSSAPQPVEYPIPTGTKIYMNLGVPEKISEYLNLPFDGIGLMRIEFIMSAHIGEHPVHLIEVGEGNKFVEKLAEGIAAVARQVQPRPVVVRFSDFKSNEYRELKGGEKYEPFERNPMLGYRGVSRYISPQYEEAFRLECRAIKKVRDEWGLKNVWAMLPFVRTTWETEKVLKIMADEGLERGRDFKVWAMAEVPSVIFMADEFCRYVDGFSIGSNDLTQLILGVDRDSEVLPKLDARYFDERDPAVLRAIRHLIRTAHKHGVTVSICGQGPSYLEDLVEWLVREGVDSISVNPDAIARVRRVVAQVERRVLLEGALKAKRVK
ncbi:MAG: phosphoenolpyruvate synthase [Candidatus Nezhaarchaeota archaeon]|nr:phosphoenolpyruvate synthase [Candidatus Nezhaarchaeota archaeon]